MGGTLCSPHLLQATGVGGGGVVLDCKCRCAKKVASGVAGNGDIWGPVESLRLTLGPRLDCRCLLSIAGV